jgi:hypothetical protein
MFGLAVARGEARAGGRGRRSTVAALFSTVHHNFIKDFLHVGCIFPDFLLIFEKIKLKIENVIF